MNASVSTTTTSDTDVIVDVRKLWTAFGEGERQVVIHQDLDLVVTKGEILTLVGGSGTGKSVLLRQMRTISCGVSASRSSGSPSR